ncbi:hypothetical protein [Methylobacterium indicum]|uniref:Uncharacterized protein n=1 Tax=Methylobacterium indicum TaxID=1775910 RepID=A0A8H8X026_9HYPH|nr:hypothetical protein [Methylobacterium indicum]BCM87731.1 hypothetical protein mvi_61920 [Methylobacterium indicum]
MNPIQKPDRGSAFGAGWKARRDAARKRELSNDKMAEIRAERARHYAAQAAGKPVSVEPAPETFDMRPEEERKANPRPAPAPATAPEQKPARKAKRLETTDDGAVFEE